MNDSDQLLQNIKKNLIYFEIALQEANAYYNEEDCFYRFYHQSYKVYYLQSCTKYMLDLLYKIKPKGTTLNSWFINIINSGINKKFTMEINNNWIQETLPILNSFFHIKHVTKQIIKYGKKLEKSSNCLLFGWATILYIFNLRYKHQ